MKNKIQYLTEGSVDSVLLTVLNINPKLIDIQGSNSSLSKAMENQKENYHKIIIGLTDEDRGKNLPRYFSEFETIDTPDNIILKKRPKSNQFLIFLCCPAIENWLLTAAKEAGVKSEDYGISSKMKMFIRVTKNRNVSKNINFMKFLRKIRKANVESFYCMKKVLEKLQNNEY